jgi:hypothetical protein
MSKTAGAHWGSRIASWVVAAIGLGLVLLIVGNWVDVIGQMMIPDRGGEEAGFPGPAIFGAIGATFPFAAGIWGLWHLHRLFAERAAGQSLGAARRFRSMGLALMAIAVLLVGAGYALGGMAGPTGSMPVLPAHGVIFGLGFVIFAVAEWRLWRAGRKG